MTYENTCVYCSHSEVQLILLRMEGHGTYGEHLSVEAPAGTFIFVVRESVTTILDLDASSEKE